MSSDATGTAPRRDGLRIEIVPRTIALLLLAVAIAWLAWQLWTVILVIGVALVLVGTFDPLLTWFEHHGFRRGRALLLIFFAMTVLVAALLLLTLPPLVGQVLHILEDAPKERAHLIAWLSQYEWAGSLVKTIKAVPIDDVVAGVTKHVVGYSSDLLAAIGYGVTTIFLAVYLLAEPKRANGLLYALVPRHHHMKLARILLELEAIVGGYMRGQLITSVSISIFMFAMLTVLQVPDALAIAIFAGLTDIIPFVGGILASAPAVLATWSIGSVQTIVVAAMCFLYQEFENRVLVPRVYGRQLRLSPAVVMVSLLIGGTLLGILGALLALPIAAGVQMVIRELRVELPGEVQTSAAARSKDAKAEHIYEALTQGAGAADAAVIASDLAQVMKHHAEDGRSPSESEIIGDLPLQSTVVE